MRKPIPILVALAIMGLSQRAPAVDLTLDNPTTTAGSTVAINVTWTGPALNYLIHHHSLNRRPRRRSLVQLAGRDASAKPVKLRFLRRQLRLDQRPLKQPGIDLSKHLGKRHLQLLGLDRQQH